MLEASIRALLDAIPEPQRGLVSRHAAGLQAHIEGAIAGGEFTHLERDEAALAARMAEMAEAWCTAHHVPKALRPLVVAVAMTRVGTLYGELGRGR